MTNIDKFLRRWNRRAVTLGRWGILFGAPMTTLSERIKAARVALGLSQDELARRVNSTRVSVSGWERDINRPREHLIPKLAQVLKLQPSQLTPFGEGGVNVLASSSGNAKIPQIVWGDLPKVAGGTSPMDLAQAWISIDPDNDVSSAEFRVEVVDDSMAPAFRSGDRLRVNQEIKPWAGCQVIALLDGADSAILRHYRPRSGGAVDLVPESPDWPTVTLNAQQAGQIIGVVVRHIRVIRPPSDA